MSVTETSDKAGNLDGGWYSVREGLSRIATQFFYRLSSMDFGLEYLETDQNINFGLYYDLTLV